MADLIDRAALLEQLDDLHNHCGHCDGYGYISKDKAMQKVKVAPTIDAEPVKHGYWDDSGRYKFPSGATAVRCTICGCALQESEYKIYNWHYCPCCGAKMDGERETE